MEVYKIIILAYLIIAILNGLLIALTSKKFKRIGFFKQMFLFVVSPLLLAREFTTRRGK
jgi:uncharacterized membrane protein